MRTPFAHTRTCALLFALAGIITLVAGTLAWNSLDVQPTQVEAVTTAAEDPYPPPQAARAMVRAPQVEPRATGAAVSQRERFAGRTAELLEWHRAGRPGDLHADLEAGTLAIRNLGHTAGDLERKTLSTPATGQRRRRRGSSRRTRRLALSRREREALGLVSQRLTDPEIAVLFVLSSRTVEAHVSRVLHQLGAANRRAAAIAARHGLIWRWRQDGIRVRFRFGAGGSAWPGNVAIRPTRHSWHTWHTSPAVMASTGRW